MAFLSSRSRRNTPLKSVLLRGFLAIGIVTVGTLHVMFVSMPVSKVRNQVLRNPLRVQRLASSTPPDVSTMKSMLDDADIIKQAQAMGLEDLGAVKQLMDDPDKFGELQKAVGAMMQHVIASDVIKTLESDPELEHFFKEVKEDGAGALMKYAKDDLVQSKLRAAHQALQEKMTRNRLERNTNEEWIKKVFDEFDKDQDGILNLDEFNALQLATEGPHAVYNLEQLEDLLQNINPEVKDTSSGMFFAEYRKMYVDADTSTRYATDLVRDYEKIFGKSTVSA